MGGDSTVRLGQKAETEKLSDTTSIVKTNYINVKRKVSNLNGFS